MIPIRDTIPSRHFPFINSTLIGLNTVIFFYQMLLGDALPRFIFFYGLVPARYSVPEVTAYFSTGQQLFSLVSFMFLHGGFLHLIGNMWSLYIFGDNVEDRLGPLRYLFFYLSCGIASGLSQFLSQPYSESPLIGASGAIAGVMGAYFLLYPRSKILTLIPIIIIPWFIEIPAFIFLGFWFVLQFLNAAGVPEGGGIAWWAHIGGFVFGMAFLKLLTLMPDIGITAYARRITRKKKTHRLQVIRPNALGEPPHLYGLLSVSAYEAKTGSLKLVNIPTRAGRRLIRVNIPAGIQEGQKLRLKGLGILLKDGQRGDLLLKLKIR